MEFKIITDEQGLLAERKEWTGIYHSMKHATPFQSWEWNYAWWKNNEPADSLYIIKAYVANTTYAYAPLVVKRNNAEFIGGRDMDYGRFLVCLDFMRGDYDFKLRWECELDTNYTVYKLNSRTAFLGKKIYFWLRKIAKRFVYSHSTLKGIYKKYAR